MRGNTTHSISDSVSHGLEGYTGAGNESEKENNEGTGEKCGLPCTNMFFQQDVERDKRRQKQNRRPVKR